MLSLVLVVAMAQLPRVVMPPGSNTGDRVSPPPLVRDVPRNPAPYVPPVMVRTPNPVRATLVPGACPRCGQVHQANPAPGYSSIQAQLIAAHNERRGGRSPLQPHAALMGAAQQHANDMARTGRMSHGNLGHGSLSTRTAAMGYPSGNVGENIAKGQTSVEQVMRGWMMSPGHRMNILKGSYRYIGVGYARDGGGREYWAADFGG